MKRYAFFWCLMAYMAGIVILHGLGLFPRPGLYNLSRLQGAPLVTLEGKVMDNPVVRWGQTRFLMKGHAVPLSAFSGDVFVTLPYPDLQLGPGDRVCARGWLARPPPRSASYWSSRGVYTFFKVWSDESVLWIRPSASWGLKRLAWRFHRQYREFWERRLPQDESALLIGVTIGARGLLPPRVKEACIRAGVYHIVVVSGQNMSFIVGLGVTLLLALSVPRRHALWVCVLPVLFYALAVGADPPVLRAALTALIGLLVAALSRDVPRYYPMGLAAAWILLWDPEALLGASFQLSFGATLCIMAMLPYSEDIQEGRAFWLTWVRQSAFLGCAVYIGIWPILAHYFQRLSLIGLLANVIVFPLSGLLMMMGLFIGTWGTVAPETIPLCLTTLTGATARLTLWLIHAMARCRWATMDVAPLPPEGLLLYYGSLFGILLLIHRRRSKPI